MLYFYEVYQVGNDVSRMMRLLFIGLILFSSLVHARMYQWIEPDSGTTQLSGKPPAWYRSEEGGPRVFVFEAGRVIDDTTIKVSDRERELLRQRAFIKVEEDEEIARGKLERANKLKEEFDNKSKETSVQEPPSVQEPLEEIEAMESSDAPAVAADLEIPRGEAGDKILEEMRALIAEWEKKQSRSALETIEKSEGLAPETSPANPGISGSPVPAPN